MCVVQHEGSLHSGYLVLCVSDGGGKSGVEGGIDRHYVGVERLGLVAAFGYASHISVFNAYHVVVEVSDRLVAVGRLYVVHILAGMRFADFLCANLVGDIHAAVDDSLHGVCPCAVCASRFARVEHVIGVAYP